MRTMMKRLAIVGAIITLVCLGFGLFAHRSAKSGPRFYREALKVDRDEYEKAGEQFEIRVADLHNEVRREGTWDAVFSEDQINGWLATDLPDKFPHALPATVSEPRVSLHDDGIRVAFAFANDRFDGVVSFHADMYLTDDPNVIAIKIGNLRAGIIPLPIDRWTRTISRSASRTGLKVRWTQDDGLPLALVTIPERSDEYSEHAITVNHFSIRAGQVSIGGTTVADKEDGPILTANRDNQSGSQNSVQH